VLHEAADVEACHPTKIRQDIDLLFIGNWSDDRASWMNSYFFKPSPFKKVLHGVRYPDQVLKRMKDGGVDYRGYLPNYKVPEMMCESKIVLHVHRGPYVKVLKGIPTIRVFKALACGSCLVSSPWKDTEGLFREGDFVVAKPEDAEVTYRKLLRDDDLRREYGERGRETILKKHTCAHRARELVEIIEGTSKG
jgi:spore maturation protein CgeB